MSANDSTEELPPPGRVLAAAREASGRSTADVAAALKLRQLLVEGIEQDDFSRCGGDVYARWHLRDYAHLLGLDDGPLLAAYAARRQGAPTAAPLAQPPTSPEAQQPGAKASAGAATGRRSRAAKRAKHPVVAGPVPPLRLSGPGIPTGPRKPPWTLLTGLALTGLVAYLSVQLVGELRAPARPSQEVASPVTVSPAPTSSPSPSSSSSPRSSATAPQLPAAPSRSASPSAASSSSSSASPTQRPAKKPAGRVAIALRATGDSWVTVRAASGHTKFSGLLGKGEQKEFTDADGLRVILGNAGGVQLTVNGQRVGPAGRDGEVKRLTIKPGDPA